MRTVLGQKQTFALLKYMEDPETGYVASRLDDPAFAARAAIDLKIPGLNRGHVGTARKTLDLPPNVQQSANPSKLDATLHIKVSQLEELVLAQSVRLDDCIRKIETLQHDFRLHPPVPPRRSA